MRKLLLTLLIAGGTLASCTKEIIREVEKPEKPENQLNNGGLNNSGSSGSGNTSGSTSGSSVNNEPVKQAKIKTYYEAVQIHVEKNFWLYSKWGEGSQSGAISFVLPKNSVALYYAFSTSKKKQDQVKNLNLLKQIKDFIAKDIYALPIGKMDSFLTVPDTGYLEGIDVYFIDSNQKEDFLKGNGFMTYTDFNYTNRKKSYREVTGLKAMFFNDPQYNRNFSLGFFNDNQVQGVGVTVEVVAVVKKEKTVYE
ncbi:hypothetical protein [Capnocytophaga canis]|uniref:hypothetical protein n=1 Tax=Capnocytophaga canis TaxID=1848903 RepID=UPI001562C984|nr:hypothetical protein [Capnocytophaga canis]